MGFTESLALALPKINAFFNALSSVLLVLGYIAIKNSNVALHLRLMLSALLSSALFLVGYLTRMALTGTHSFAGHGLLRTFYLCLLFSHMVLAVLLLPLLARVLYLAYHERFAAHKRLAKVVWPVWMYVSVTGVMVYLMLYHVADRL